MKKEKQEFMIEGQQEFIDQTGYRPDTFGTHPVSNEDILIFFTRYQKGNLVRAELSEIEKITPRKKYRGGTIIFKGGQKDIFYRLWPIKFYTK